MTDADLAIIATPDGTRARPRTLIRIAIALIAIGSLALVATVATPLAHVVAPVASVIVNAAVCLLVYAMCMRESRLNLARAAAWHADRQASESELRRDFRDLAREVRAVRPGPGRSRRTRNRRPSQVDATLDAAMEGTLIPFPQSLRGGPRGS